MTQLETIREMYRAMRAGDDAAFTALCTDDLVWQQSAGFPGGSTWHGAAAVIENVFRANAKRWTGFAFNEEEMFATEDRVVVLGHYSGASPATGKAMRTAVAHVYDMREGKIARFRMFADTQPMWRAMEA
ncbi:nuclear transport factor 2 family protein [Prosthecobacter sp.]|uniref:nuclear transport factor 2 family protein n=1 Tax=Prosthecobacter sp. TaxID=1965333 RepID=UPI002489B60B|nr:nuclear transport factor 2 family protein [Prosthecobacter sp.]MDI1312446.1 nuclear transport factor 2 family protein [Prosthecobacter sp.]